MIAAKHPVREVFASRSSGSYYPTKGTAIDAFDGALGQHDFHFDREDLLGFDGDEGRKLVQVMDDGEVVVGNALLTWYRMPSGCYEFVGYLA